jgi:hypothetical protein
LIKYQLEAVIGDRPVNFLNNEGYMHTLSKWISDTLKFDQNKMKLTPDPYFKAHAWLKNLKFDLETERHIQFIKLLSDNIVKRMTREVSSSGNSSLSNLQRAINRSFGTVDLRRNKIDLKRLSYSASSDTDFLKCVIRLGEIRFSFSEILSKLRIPADQGPGYHTGDFTEMNQYLEKAFSDCFNPSLSITPTKNSQIHLIIFAKKCLKRFLKGNPEDYGFEISK